MWDALALFKKHRFITLHIIILSVAFFSFRYFIERLLFPIVGMGWAYLVDQTTPLLIATTASLFFLKRRTSLKTIHAKLKTHYRLLCLIFVTAFVTHLGILYYFFFAEEVNFILNPITQNAAFEFHQASGTSMRGYFIASYAFLYLMFGLHAWIYPLFSITYFAISTLFVYWFLYLLTNRKLVAAVASLFFATTPAYLDMFSWHTTAHAPTLILGLSSFISLLYYKKRGAFIYYILSVMFFFITIKINFIRSFGFTFIPLLLFLLPLYKKAQQKPLQIITHWLPYIMIALYFVLLEFIHAEFLNLVGVLSKTGNLSYVFDFFLDYRGIEYPFLPKLLYFTVHLLIPSGLVAEILPFWHLVFPKTSIVLSLGILIYSSLLATLVFILKSGKQKGKWLVLFALIFVILNMLHNIIGFQPGDYLNSEKERFAELIDRQFSREDIGYGPGSRYIFISSVGASLLFGLFVAWLASKGKRITILAILVCTAIIGSNTYFSIRAQIQNFKGMTIYKSLAENIFKLVPRDGKPKLLLSFDREQNSLERKFGGWQWLYGFYKEDELYYTKDIKEARDLIKNNKYLRENLYAFYQNPHTLTYRDISDEVRDYFYSSSKTPRNTPIFFSQGKSSSTDKMFTGAGGTNFLERAIIKSLGLDTRNIAPQRLYFKLKLKRLENPPIPFSDAALIEEGKGYPYNFPLDLWKRVAVPPEVINKTAAEFYNPLPDQKQSAVLNILKERDNLMDGTRIKRINMTAEEENAIQSLIDGFYTTYPKPKEEERYFVSNDSPVALTLNFPYTIAVKRILLNTPSSYSFMSPKNITVSVSTNNKDFNEVKTIENATPAGWSPNNGKMYQIDFDKKTDAQALRLTITGATKTIALDEIVVDNENAVEHSPQEIHEISRNAYHYVNSKELLKELAQIKRYDRLTVLWACAEDLDWQEQIKNKGELMPGIWNIAKVVLPHNTSGEVEDSVPINCYGGKLRQALFVSPPYPVEMEFVKAVIE